MPIAIHSFFLQDWGTGLSSTLSSTNLYYEGADTELLYSLEETAMAEEQPGNECVSEEDLL